MEKLVTSTSAVNPWLSRQRRSHYFLIQITSATIIIISKNGITIVIMINIAAALQVVLFHLQLLTPQISLLMSMISSLIAIGMSSDQWWTCCRDYYYYYSLSILCKYHTHKTPSSLQVQPLNALNHIITSFPKIKGQFRRSKRIIGIWNILSIITSIIQYNFRINQHIYNSLDYI